MRAKASDSTAVALLTVLAGSLLLPLLLVGAIFLIIGLNAGSGPGAYTVIFAKAGDECGAQGQYLDVSTGKPLQCMGPGGFRTASLEFPGFSREQNDDVRRWLTTLAEDGGLDVFDHRSVQAKIDGIAAGLPPGTRVEPESGATKIWIGAALTAAGLALVSGFAWQWRRNRQAGY
ncbi:hypothetical protein [Amycolatopsis azurea]|uniref:Uncharacterized protein n=1 Tax=Amycolatopsis azurea DSM 43854 TaxID=1238180 RepID=M2NN74_9PSEU|nr:hypothetical protein [Amycolatopsis azurea]EMD23619.1 hypothetical protein C791_7050 [Amycolatopsis azurea DSM 43854]OOC03969.1 hypothetical protein B0293_25135 [Amycolatopsis azurea DSM 43854]